MERRCFLIPASTSNFLISVEEVISPFDLHQKSVRSDEFTGCGRQELSVTLP